MTQDDIENQVRALHLSLRYATYEDKRLPSWDAKYDEYIRMYNQMERNTKRRYQRWIGSLYMKVVQNVTE